MKKVLEFFRSDVSYDYHSPAGELNGKIATLIAHIDGEKERTRKAVEEERKRVLAFLLTTQTQVAWDDEAFGLLTDLRVAIEKGEHHE